MRNIIQEMRREADNCNDKHHYYTANLIIQWADILESSGVLVPLPDGNRCLLRHVTTDCLLADDGDIYRRSDDGDWWSLADRFKFLVSKDMFVQPMRYVPITSLNGGEE